MEAVLNTGNIRSNLRSGIVDIFVLHQGVSQSLTRAVPSIRLKKGLILPLHQNDLAMDCSVKSP